MRKNGYVLRRRRNEDFPYWQGEDQGHWVASIQEAWLFVDYTSASKSCGRVAHYYSDGRKEELGMTENDATLTRLDRAREQLEKSL